MKLIALIDSRQRNRDRFEAALHGVSLPDESGQVPVERTPIRRFHEKMKASYSRRGRG